MNALNAVMSGTNSSSLTEEECQKYYGCSLSEMDEQITWMSYVKFRVKALTGQDINEAIICIIIEEFGKRIKELENKEYNEN